MGCCGSKSKGGKINRNDNVNKKMKTMPIILRIFIFLVSLIIAIPGTSILVIWVLFNHLVLNNSDVIKDLTKSIINIGKRLNDKVNSKEIENNEITNSDFEEIKE